MKPRNAFAERFGFERSAVALANWRTAPFNRWGFQNTRELVPTTGIASPSHSAPPPPAPAALLSETVTLGGATVRVADFLHRSETDILLVLKDGREVLSWAAPHADFERPHLVFSISKSMTALVAGILAGQGALDLEAPAVSILPDAAGSAYGDAGVRDVLDMRVSLDFTEDYTDPAGGFARYRRATLWNPPDGDKPETLRDFLLSLRKGEDRHCGAFRYRSPNSDFLGLLLEAASGERFADLMRRLLMEPMGATGEALVTVDAAGAARTAGGISMTARDLAAVGELMRSGGAARGRQVVPKDFVRDTLTGGDRQAWKEGDMPTLFAEGAYRNKWYATGEASGSFAAIGIHGQWLFVDPTRAVTIVKFSSQTLPVDLPLDLDTLAFFHALTERL